jgi:hypothetical protein
MGGELQNSRGTQWNNCGSICHMHVAYLRRKSNTNVAMHLGFKLAKSPRCGTTEVMHEETHEGTSDGDRLAASSGVGVWNSGNGCCKMNSDGAMEEQRRGDADRLLHSLPFMLLLLDGMQPTTHASAASLQLQHRRPWRYSP